MITDAAGATNFGHMFGAYLIVWALFTAMLTIGARYVNVPAFAAFVLLVVVYVLLGIGNLVGSAGAANALMKARAVLAWSAHWPRPLRGNPPQRRERAHPVAWSASRGTRLISGRTVCSILPAVRTRFGEDSVEG
jgi:hypothetical protein